ncbi:hypothetical protein ACFLSJ_07615, partial [Verrucomicrobiota bacterium]
MGSDRLQLDQLLANSGTITPEQMKQARKHAGEHGVSLSEALVSLKALGYDELGECLSAIHELPYVPLLPSPPSEQARSMLSPKAAAAWSAFPVAYDAEASVLTLAVSDLAGVAKLEKVRRLLLQNHVFAFTVASDGEIKKALETYFGVALSPPKLPKIKVAGGRRPSVKPGGRPFSTIGPAGTEEYPYGDMSGALTNMAALMAALYLEHDP